MNIGHLNPFGEHKDDPFPYYAKARVKCPVDFNPTLGAYVVTRYDDVVDILGDTETFSSSIAIPRNDQCNPAEVLDVLGPDFQGAPGVRLVVADPPEHAALKRVGMQLFRRERVNAIVPQIRKIGTGLIDTFLPAGTTELVSQFAEPFAFNVLCDFLGFPEMDRSAVRIWTDQFIVLMDPTASTENKIAAAEAMHDWSDYVVGLVSSVTKPRDDLVSEMIAMDCTAKEIRSYLEGALGAGIYTARDLIASSVLTLLQPESRKYWQEIRQRPELASAVIEEAMRHDAPHKGLNRLTTQDAHLSGVFIPAGSIVMPLVGSANRDADVFAEPDTFDPHRKNTNQHLALGRGIHLCMGAYLARTEASIALELLVQALPDVQLTTGFIPEYFPSPYFRGLKEMRLTW